MNIEYFVRTTGERKFNYDLDYELLIDTEHKPIESYIESLYKINNYNSVLLEDDLVLCKNFKKEIESVIAQYPNCIINFFSNPDRYFTTHFSQYFNYNQCTYYPKGIASKIADIMKVLSSRAKYKSYDVLVHQALEQLGMIHLVYRPCLVQHIDGNSILNNGDFYTRNTLYFKDYLDELGIDIIDAYRIENRNKLKELLEADRNTWYNKDNN